VTETKPRLIRDFATIDPPRSVLVVIAHPDDIEALCGGTVALLAESGAQITYLVLTSGDKGSPDPLIDPHVLGATREAEQRAAAAMLDIDDVVFLRYHDGEVADDLPTRAAVAAQMRRVRPDLLIAFDPWHDYTFHNDHRQSGLVALAAARTLARQPGPANGADGAVVEMVAPPHTIPEAWLFLTGQPNLVFDIAPTIERKVAARLAHASQAADPAGVARGVRTRAESSGAPYGVALAETFHAVRFPLDESFMARLAAGDEG
jgi:LmbE family N-acetylglucosaminyl deacetylase